MSLHTGGYVFRIVLILLVSIGQIICQEFNSSFTPDHIHYLQLETKNQFLHAWNSYKDYGFPADEVRPITCEPYGPDYKNIDDTVRNDALGNVSSTLLDNIDSLVIFELWDDLEFMLDYLNSNRDIFNQDTIVQVFELSIRSLGGLLSAHLLLTDVTNKQRIPEKYLRLKKISDNYDGFLLDLAYDLGLRIIPAYKTSSRIPVPRINLAKGVLNVPAYLQRDACTSGAATPVLELTLLSRLTGDPQFEHLSQMTFWKLWASKSKLNLLPMTIDPIDNQWKDAISGIGASIDSFYEYAAKAAIVFNDKYMWSVFKTSYKALLAHSVQGGAPNDGSMIFSNIGIHDGIIVSDWIDSLGAFWSGLQVLTGQLSDAIKTHVVYLKLWDYYESIPERWVFAHFNNRVKGSNKLKNSIALEWYPLRPEFIESTYYLYRATRDPMYLQIGERILNLFKNKFKRKCGFSGIQDIRNGQIQNRMETFVMGETLKYLYLLFDVNDEIFLHDDYLMGSKNWIFSTEAHPLWFNKKMQAKTSTNYTDQDNQDTVKLNKKLYSPVLSLIHSYDSRRENLFQAEDRVYYRNITLPPVNRYSLPSDTLYKKDPLVDRFDTCELNPLTIKPTAFLQSGYYEWNRLFMADHTFGGTLIRPPYLSQSQLDNTYIELTRTFFDKFTMFTGKNERGLYLQSPRISTTEKYELFMGDIKEINEVEITQLYFKHNHNVSSTPVLEGDFWIPEIRALKVLIEKLVANRVDSNDRVITHKYIESVRVDDYNEEGVCSPDNQQYQQYQNQKPIGHTGRDIDIVLRVLKVNGIDIPPGAIIWTLPFIPHAPEPGKESLISIASDNRVILQGNVIENVMVWGGSA
ncbi:alpha-mannosidase [Scheffersomyces amazonensis]|uniref:alpha-mannosidase n=1 Tax=Scheffersomyces amazonensis TaxID=1078765 RepID=UPI00315D924C